MVLSNSLYGFDYQIANGSNLLGAVEDINDLTIFNNKCVEYIYYQDFSKLPDVEWVYHSVNGTFPEEGTPLTKIEKGKGFMAVAVGDCTVTLKEDFVFKGDSYGVVTSPTTGRVWLDRNLGASKVCDRTRSEFNSDAEYASSQEECFGDYYQWGRKADGHEKKDSLTSTSIRSSINTGTYNRFIKSTNSSYHYDWVSPDSNGNNRSDFWSESNGSGICPVGFRVPTISELQAETVNLPAFVDTLKLPIAGKRDRSTANFYFKGYVGYLWSTSTDSYYTKRLSYDNSNVFNLTYKDDRAAGYSIRCIKD